MTRRRALMAKLQSGRLPEEYQEVEYLETTGGQYLQTEIVPATLDFVSLIFAKNNIQPPSSPINNCLYSAGDGTYQFVTVFTQGVSSLFYIYGRYFSNTASSNQCGYSRLPSSTDYVWFEHHTNGKTQAQSCEILDTGYQFWIGSPYKSSQLSGNNTKLRLFSRWGESINSFVGRAKNFYVERNGSRIIDLVPCYRKQDFKPGMYDLISGTFLTNQGTGEFTVGSDVN